jgi:YesN/AraC family two-component response regulator
MAGSVYKFEDVYSFLIPEETPPFWVEMAGISYCNGSYVVDRDDSDVTVIEYVYKGTGTLRVGQSIYHPEAGDIYILTEKSNHSYRSDSANPWTKMFVNLKGTAVSAIVQAFDLHKKVVYSNCEAMSPIFEDIFELVKKNVPVEQIMEESSMQILKLLTRLCQHEARDRHIPDEAQNLKRFIDNNYQRNLSMDEIAGSIYHSNDYANKLFKRFYGSTPYAYYLEVKMANAKALLQRTNLSIKQIADRLGYKNDQYFSKQFHKSVGVTASQYRNSDK